MQVHVASHPMQRYGVWFGGSVLGMMPEFPAMCCSRAEYEERGCFRSSVVSESGQSQP